jgi:hypothetical protein
MPDTAPSHPTDAPTPERILLEKQIADLERYIEHAAIFQYGLVCDLPVIAALYWAKKRLAALGG